MTSDLRQKIKSIMVDSCNYDTHNGKQVLDEIMEEINKTTDWISIKDRLPIDIGCVLWFPNASYAFPVVGRFNQDDNEVVTPDFYGYTNDTMDLSAFSHWQSLPKPPEET